jgi:AraC family transcriptional regulator
VRLAAKLFREFEQADDLTPLTAEGIALELLAETSRHAAPWMSDARTAAPWLRETCDLLHARFNENLSLAEVAGAAAVHPSHLARAFRRQYGSTVGEYVRQLRIDWACERIRSDDARLTDIAVAAGFSDQSHFTKTFKASSA